METGIEMGAFCAADGCDCCNDCGSGSWYVGDAGDRQTGAELLAGAVLAGALVTGIPMALFTEISVYRNCRYFLVGKKKTALTVLNAVMLVVSAAWVVGLRLSFDTFYQIGEYIWFGSFGVLLLLRFAYAWILSCTSPEPDSTPSESTPTPPESQPASAFPFCKSS